MRTSRTDHVDSLIVEQMLQLTMSRFFSPISDFQGRNAPTRNGQAVDASWVNGDLVRSWKDHCDKEHSGICLNFPGETFSRVRPAWLIDVLEECLVEGSGCQPYVALSYVWGQVDMFKTLRSTVDLLQRPRALSNINQPISIAKTIRDAMEWVRVLGERYLWADALCIIQDVDDEKQKEIARMAGIFANATVTLVAAQGPDASYGLRGLKDVTEARVLDRPVHKILGEMVTILPVPPRQFGSSYPRSPWSTRRWTFQEGLFSRRQVIFEFNALHWKCAHDEFQEGELPGWNNPGRNPSRFSDSIYDSSTDIPSKWFIIMNQGLPNTSSLLRSIRNYNDRLLTYPQDSLWAFNGIASAFKETFLGPFITGLPSAFFNVALLWKPDPFGADGKMRGDEKTLRNRRAATNKFSDADACLPSWSWAGWKCQLDEVSWSEAMEWTKHQDEENPTRWDCYMSPMSCTSGRQWEYKMTPSQEERGTPIRDLWLEYRDKYMHNETRLCPPGWSRHSISDSSQLGGPFRDSNLPDAYKPRFIYKHDSVPDREFLYPLPIEGRRQDSSPAMIFAPYITCRTKKAGLFVHEFIVGVCDRRFLHVALRDQQGSWAGSLQTNEGLDTLPPECVIHVPNH